ncbi:MAG: hypothetical protein SVR94_15285, partial [Pseudomonadota bacterium]|nr:hypothetical protein [Pseudomonadota bacterium]
QIIGEAQDPALLTDMTVKSGSHLAHVLIGDGVRFGEQVTFDAVQFVDPKMDPRTQQPPEDDTTPPEDEEPAPACDTELPQLGALATDAEGKSLAIQTQLAGGIAVNEGEFKRKTTLNLADPVLVQGQLCVAAEHQGQNADIVVYAAYSAPEIERQFYMLNTQSEVMLWNEQPAELVAFLRNKRLKASQTIELYEGQFVAPGALAVHFGYRLADGTIVVTDEVIDLTIE